MSEPTSDSKNYTDEEPEEGEIQDDEELEDVSSDDEIASLTKTRESILHSHVFVHQQSVTSKRQCLIDSSRSDMRFHVLEKPEHNKFIQKLSHSSIHAGGHDNYYSQRYKSYKEHNLKGRIHEKENKARETKKQYKKSSFYLTAVDPSSVFITSERGEGRFSSSSSKAPRYKCEMKDKHRKKKKSKSSKSYPLVEVHESQLICEKDPNINECIKNSTNMKEDSHAFEEDKKEVEEEENNKSIQDVPSPPSSDVEILDVPVRVPEVITIGDSDEELHPKKEDEGNQELNIVENFGSVNCDVPAVDVKSIDIDQNVKSVEIDENLDLLREAALNSSKSDQAVNGNLNPDDEVLQLRLAALRSAIIRKCEERKKRGITLTKRNKNAGEKHVMSISPLSSPNHCSSDDSFIRISEETNLYISSGEFNGSCCPPEQENNSEVDKISAVDMELVESDEDKEFVSIHSDDAGIHEVLAENTANYHENYNEKVVYLRETNDKRSLIFNSKEIVSQAVLQNSSACQSPVNSLNVQTLETPSGYVIGDQELPISCRQGPLLPTLHFPFVSQLSAHENNGFVSELDQPLTVLHSEDEPCGLNNEQDSDREKVCRELSFTFHDASNSQPTSLGTTADMFDLGNDKSENDQSLDLLLKAVDNSNDSCSTKDLNIESMIVLDEVGKCSDDSKSESSMMEIPGCFDNLLSSPVRNNNTSPESCVVNSLGTLISSSCLDKDIAQCSFDNIDENCGDSEACTQNIMVVECNDIVCDSISSNFPNVNKQCNSCLGGNKVNGNNLKAVNGNPSELNNGTIRIASDTHILSTQSKANDNICSANSCGKINCNLSKCESSSNQPRLNYSSEKCIDLEVETSSGMQPEHSSGMSLGSTPACKVNSDFQKNNNLVENKCVDVRLKLSFGSSKNIFFISEEEEIASDSLKHINFSSNAEKSTDSLLSHNRGIDESLPTKSNMHLLTRKENEKDLHLVDDPQVVCETISSGVINSPVEDDEEVLRHSLLAMLSKRTEDMREQHTELKCSSQCEEIKEQIPVNSNNGSCDAEYMDSDSLDSKLKDISLPFYADVSSIKLNHNAPPVKEILPSKSTSNNLIDYQHHLSLALAKRNVYTSRNKLISGNKRGIKGNKRGGLTSNPSGRTNINIPELVINLGEDSDSGEDTMDKFIGSNTSKIVSEDCLDSSGGAQVVPPDFEKKLDLLLKQARFEQETNTNEEKDDIEDNQHLTVDSPLNLLNNVGKEGIVLSLEKSNENSCDAVCNSKDKMLGNPSGISASQIHDFDSITGKSDNILAPKNKRTCTNSCTIENKIISSVNISKMIPPNGKKSASTVNYVSPPVLSAVDIGLLPSNKQKEYIRLKTQLAQLASKDDKNSKCNFEYIKCVERKNKKEENSLLPSYKSTTVRHNVGNHADKSMITRKLIRRVQLGTQSLRNELSKARRFIRTVPVTYGAQSQFNGRISLTSSNKDVRSSDFSPLHRILTSQQKKVNAAACVKKVTTGVQLTANSKQKKPTAISFARLPSGKATDANASLNVTHVSKCAQERQKVDTVPVSKGSTQVFNVGKSPSLKRKKSISENSGASLRKKSTTRLETCDDELNSSQGCSNPKCLSINTDSTKDKKLTEDLWSSESKLLAKRYQVLEDIAAVRINLHEIQKVNVIKHQIIMDIKVLKEKISLAETQLSEKEEMLKNLFSEVEDTKRNIMRRQSETLLLSVECEEKGCKIHGSTYNIPNTCTDLIRNGMLSISKTLENLKKRSENLQPDCGMSTFCLSGEQRLKEDVHCIARDFIENANDMDLNKEVQHSYSSPLDAIRTESSSNNQAVLCPYHIMGSCKDKECSYLH